MLFKHCFLTSLICVEHGPQRSSAAVLDSSVDFDLSVYVFTCLICISKLDSSIKIPLITLLWKKCD